MNGLYAFWTQHLPILPVLLPAFTAMALLLLGDAPSGHAQARSQWGRRISLLSLALGLWIAVSLVQQASEGTLQVYRLGDWLENYDKAKPLHRIGRDHEFSEFTYDPSGKGYPAKMSGGRDSGYASGMYAFQTPREGDSGTYGAIKFPPIDADGRVIGLDPVNSKYMRLRGRE